MAWYDDIANTTKGNVQGLINALRNPQDIVKQGALYKKKDALAALLLHGDTAPIMAKFNEKSPANPMEALDAAMMLGTIKGVDKNPFIDALKIAQYNASLPVSKGGLGLHPQNTQLDRMKVMAEPENFYHGTAETGDYRHIDPAQMGKATKSLSAKKAWWEASDPNTAAGYADFAAMDSKVQQLIDESQAAERSAHGGIFPRIDAEKQKYFKLSEDLMNQATTLEKEHQLNPNQGQNIMPLVNLKHKQLNVDAEGNQFMDFQDEMHNALNDAIANNYPSIRVNNLSDEATYGSYNPTTHIGVINPSIVRSRFAAFDPFRRNENDIMAGVGVGALPFVDYNKKK